MVGVTALVNPDMLVEIEADAVVPPATIVERSGIT